MDKSDVRPPSHDKVRAVMGVLSRTGPEVPPDIADSSTILAPSSTFGDEPTELLPTINQAAHAVSPQRTPPAPKVAARAVIVYEPEPRRSWGLWVFTAVLVALTVGVVLGQAVAYQPGVRSVSTAQTGPMPPTAAPPEAMPSPSSQASPVAGQRVTAPLGSAKTRLIEVTGASTLLQIRSADLGALLFSVAAMDGSTMPTVEDTPSGPRLSLAQTGVAAGTVRTEVQLNSKVKWTVRLTDGSIEQEIDMRAGGLAGIELVGGASHAVLRLPRPKGTVALRVTGAVSDLQIRAGKGIPVRLRLTKGADTASLDGTSHLKVESGTAFTSPGWRSARNRYEISTSAWVGSVLVDRAP